MNSQGSDTKKLLVDTTIHAPSVLWFKANGMLSEVKKRLKDTVESLEWSGSIAYGLWSFMLAQP